MTHKLIAILLLIVTNAAHATISLEKVHGTENYTIKISKHIRMGDYETFERTLSKVKQLKLKLHMNAIQLDLLGGEPNVARKIGKLIRVQNLNTFVAPEASCTSACIYVAIAGVRRMIYGEVLVHRLSMARDDLRDDEIRESIAAFVAEADLYIKQMDGSHQLIEAINITPNWALRKLTQNEVKHWGIHGSNHITDELEFRSAAMRSGMSRSDFKEAFIEYFDVCRKEEYSFKNLILECTVNQLVLKSNSQISK